MTRFEIARGVPAPDEPIPCREIQEQFKRRFIIVGPRQSGKSTELLQNLLQLPVELTPAVVYSHDGRASRDLYNYAREITDDIKELGHGIHFRGWSGLPFGRIQGMKSVFIDELSLCKYPGQTADNGMDLLLMWLSGLHQIESLVLTCDLHHLENFLTGRRNISGVTGCFDGMVVNVEGCQWQVKKLVAPTVTSSSGRRVTV